MIDPTLIDWLLDSDVSIQYQVYRDLLNTDRPDLKERIAGEGWGAKYLSFRQENGHWGKGFYQPKWTSSHYTLLDLRNLSISNHQKEIQSTIQKILQEHRNFDGGVHPNTNKSKSDVCLNGMFLNFASYFETGENDLKSVVDFILSLQLPDGGFNCRSNRVKVTHSSLHSTLSVLEGIQEYSTRGYLYRLPELERAGEEESRQFLLDHKLFRSHRTGEIIDSKMLLLSYPSRWRYDILKALDYFRCAGVGYDPRMADALDLIIQKQKPDKKWPLQAKHNGHVHFDMEKAGQSSKWNTLRALRVLKHFEWIDKLK